MKPVGTKFEFAEQRNEDLISTYRRKLSECEVIRLPKVLRETVQSPSKRFWVSEERAIIVVMQMMAGKNLDRMQPMRKAMYEEIYRRTGGGGCQIYDPYQCHGAGNGEEIRHFKIHSSYSSSYRCRLYWVFEFHNF